jgi:hypothetical protein
MRIVSLIALIFLSGCQINQVKPTAKSGDTGGWVVGDTAVYGMGCHTEESAHKAAEGFSRNDPQAFIDDPECFGASNPIPVGLMRFVGYYGNESRIYIWFGLDAMGDQEYVFLVQKPLVDTHRQSLPDGLVEV